MRDSRCSNYRNLSSHSNAKLSREQHSGGPEPAVNAAFLGRPSSFLLLFFDQNGACLDHQVDLHIAEWLDYEIGWTGGEHNSYKARCGVGWSVVSA